MRGRDSSEGPTVRGRLTNIASALPAHVLTNAELAAQHPEWNFALLAEKAGVLQRHIARSDETALDLAEAACRRMFAERPELSANIDALVSCTQSPDHCLPSNSCRLHGRLDLPEHVATFDLSHACSGYVYALQLAQALIVSRMARQVLVVTADTYSRFIHPEDRSARSLFGDGAAATLVEASDGPSGILDVLCGTAGKGFEQFYIPAGAARMPRSAETQVVVADSSGNRRTLEHIHMAGREILQFVGAVVPRQIETLLSRNEFSLADVDLFVFHQASAMALDVLTRTMGLDPQKVFRHLAIVGNTVSSSIPLALEAARQQGHARTGMLAVLCGFGAGLSWGTALVRL